MHVEIQYPEAYDLLRDLMRELPIEKQDSFAGRVDRVCRELHHPSLGGTIVVSVGSDSTCEPPIAGSDVVLPLEGAKV